MKKSEFDRIVSLTDKPMVVSDDHGIIIGTNQAFTDSYGWTEADLIGQSLTKIIPPKIVDAHNMGFARFMGTEETSVTNQEIDLEVINKAGQIVLATHFITANKKNNKWQFAASIILRSDEE